MSDVQNLSHTMYNPNRIAGILLFTSFLIPLLALFILITSGALSAFSAGLQSSLAEKAPYATTFHLLNLLWIVGWIVQLMGFSMVTRLLLHAGDEILAIPSFIAILIAAILGVLHGTFHMSVEIWATLQITRSGSTSEAYEPLRIWIGSSFRIAYVLHLLGTAGFGWSILQTRLLPPWVGWMTIGWGILWFGGYLVRAGLPGILFLMPAVIGAALFMKSSKKSV